MQLSIIAIPYQMYAQYCITCYAHFLTFLFAIYNPQICATVELMIYLWDYIEFQSKYFIEVFIMGVDGPDAQFIVFWVSTTFGIILIYIYIYMYKHTYTYVCRYHSSDHCLGCDRIIQLYLCKIFTVLCNTCFVLLGSRSWMASIINTLLYLKRTYMGLISLPRHDVATG